FSSAGYQTDTLWFNGTTGQETQDVQYNSSGQYVDAINYANGIKTDEMFLTASGAETADEKFNAGHG
ncbi:hypothetical protein ICN48_13730, partial [Polynucleobacter sp. JS-Safj-400b-B2]|uniref:hypothetical protein n=1 Tax=Polynucleobacter sp. JS-Safj-400b-B2 TaxID=2576921 RepID=UPI001C0AAD29